MRAVVSGLSAAGAEHLADGIKAEGVAVGKADQFHVGGLDDSVALPADVARLSVRSGEGEENVGWRLRRDVWQFLGIVEPDVPP